MNDNWPKEERMEEHIYTQDYETLLLNSRIRELETELSQLKKAVRGVANEMSMQQTPYIDKWLKRLHEALKEP